MEFDKKQADRLAAQIRKNILRAISAEGKGHIGGSLSIADVFAVLYGGVMTWIRGIRGRRTEII